MGIDAPNRPEKHEHEQHLDEMNRIQRQLMQRALALGIQPGDWVEQYAPHFESVFTDLKNKSSSLEEYEVALKKKLN